MNLFGYTILKTSHLADRERAQQAALDVVRANLRAEEAEHRADVAELSAELERLNELKDILLRTNQRMMTILREHDWLEELDKQGGEAQ